MFEAGSGIVVRDVWDGLLWAAHPGRVVHDEERTLVWWSPAGTVRCSATSRSVPGRESLSPSERQSASLESRHWHYRGAPSRGTSLTFVDEDRWASVALTWLPDGQFIHWYVNFQLPPERTSAGYDTLDLIVDLVVAPDLSWAWKDREAFDLAIARGVFDQEIAYRVEAEAARIEGEIAARSGPFDTQWTEWTSPSEWSRPELPDDFAVGLGTPPGSTITLRPDPILRL